jgi:hypothetical protein
VERRFDWGVIAGQQKRMYEELICRTNEPVSRDGSRR